MDLQAISRVFLSRNVSILVLSLLGRYLWNVTMTSVLVRGDGSGLGNACRMYASSRAEILLLRSNRSSATPVGMELSYCTIG